VPTSRGICVPGFRAWGERDGRYGVALVECSTPAVASLMVTSNAIKAAPLLVSAEHAAGRVRGIIANSGCANAFTGEEGVRDAKEMCGIAARLLGGSAEEYLVASTGVIGRRLELRRVEELAVRCSRRLVGSPQGSEAAARAIMTTDTFPKVCSLRAELGDGRVVEVGGIAKGAGMIAPSLRHATMLCFIATDAAVEREVLDDALEEAVRRSFNRVVVDGDMSTNDMVVLLANGRAGNRSTDGFHEALREVALRLAKSIAKDGEGASRYLEVVVREARSEAEAEAAARAVAGSALVKTALAGADPNWGRVVAALGYSGAKVVPERLSVFIEGPEGRVCVVERGRGRAEEEVLEAARRVMRGREVRIVAHLGAGSASAEAYGCDLTCEYVRINSEYST